MVEQSEWPPSPCVLPVFSSKFERWEERAFTREGKAAGAIADMRLDWPEDRNALQVIKPPIHFQEGKHLGLHLGKSEKGVYFALVRRRCELKWVLKHEADLTGWVLKNGIEQRQVRGPWILQDINDHYNKTWRRNYEKADDIEAPV
ncbi:hypothetical protein BAE44_0008978 [Dichanthelium oligosanthes]|uniref:Uncharacterized protein n=1 Tax=Dichanthelium oligosanthes TaxID=888268 RepID=A0A1E5VY06_9POAL|nr:hypothetical protein BAE44_0008978 [Dichanthelium oligosanthes]